MRVTYHLILYDAVKKQLFFAVSSKDLYTPIIYVYHSDDRHYQTSYSGLVEL